MLPRACPGFVGRGRHRPRLLLLHLVPNRRSSTHVNPAFFVLFNGTIHVRPTLGLYTAKGRHREFRGCAKKVFFPGQIGDGTGKSATSRAKLQKDKLPSGISARFSHKNLRTCAQRRANRQSPFCPRAFRRSLGHFCSITGKKAFSRQIPGTPNNRESRH